MQIGLIFALISLCIIAEIAIGFSAYVLVSIMGICIVLCILLLLVSHIVEYRKLKD